MSDTEKQVRDDEQEIGDEEMESVSGGTVIWPPLKPTPTFPDPRLIENI
ncbi:MAG TPA: hypothetical protein VFR81_23155 [Longimicrobium sp.]|nr:hypothetical protein [Longimicrobium sp.]